MPDYRLIEEKAEYLTDRFIHDRLIPEDLWELYAMMGVCRSAFRLHLEEDGSSKMMGTVFIIESEMDKDGFITVYDNGAEPGEKLVFQFEGHEVHKVEVVIYLEKSISISELDIRVYRHIVDKLYTIRCLKLMSQLLLFAKSHDSETGLPNLTGLRTQYDEALERNPGVDYAIVFVNLQNFKYVNERIGSKGGDEVLKRYARIITLMVDEDEGVCRLGGDNFLFFIKPENLENIINRLSCVTIGELKSAPGRTIDVTAWTGIAANDTDFDFGSRIEHAGIANAFAKRQLKQPVVYYSDQYKKIQENSNRIASIFPAALASSEFHPYFQAQVSMATGELKGFEVLCRWVHDGEFIFPDQFIPEIDRLGLTYDLDMEILRLTCVSLKDWIAMGLDPPMLSVNFSRKDIFVPEVENEIKKMVDSFGIDPGYLEIEITESASESEYARIIDFTKILKSMGFKIAVDDFGTGYSSLSLIHNINADVLKIDKSFVSTIRKDSKTGVLVESIINIAQRLEMGLVAEGVETAEEGQALLELGCETAQGYYYSRPAGFEETTKILRDNPFRPINGG